MERVHCCNLLPAPSATVSVALHQPVALAVFGMTLSIVFVVTGMALMPLSLAIPLVAPVIRIVQEFFVLPFSLPCPLAFLLAAVALILNSGIWFEVASAMNASDDPVHGCPPKDDNHNAAHLAGKGGAGTKRKESKAGK